MILAEIPDEYQSTLVEEYLLYAEKGKYYRSYWIGLTNRVRKDIFQWTDSMEEANFTNWYNYSQVELTGCVRTCKGTCGVGHRLWIVEDCQKNASYALCQAGNYCHLSLKITNCRR